MGRARRPQRREPRERLRQGRAQGDDRAQAPQRLRPQARVRHAAQGAPRRPHRRAARCPRRLVANRRLAAAHLRPAGAPGCRRQGQDRRDRAADGRRRLLEHAAPRARVLQRADTAGAARLDRGASSRRGPGGSGGPGVCACGCARRSGRGLRAAGTGRRRAGTLTRAGRAGPSRRLGRADPSRDADGRGLRQGLFRRQHRSHPRSRPRRGGDRLRQRRLRAVRAGAVGPHRPRRQPGPACRDLARAVRPLPRDRAAAQVREPGARLRPAVRLVGAAVVLDAQAGRRGGQRGAAEQLAHRRPGRLDLPQLPRCRRRCPARVAGAADAAAVGVRLGPAADDRRRGERSPLRALPQLDAAGSRHALALGRAPVHGAAGSGARPATAMPTRRTGSFASTRCA